MKRAGRLAHGHMKALLKLYRDKMPEGVKNMAAGDFADIYANNGWGFWRNIENLATRDMAQLEEAVRNGAANGVLLSPADGLVSSVISAAKGKAVTAGATSADIALLDRTLRDARLTDNVTDNAAKIDVALKSWSGQTKKVDAQAAAKIAGAAKAVRISAADRDKALTSVVDRWSFNPAYVQETIEAHHRAVYRRAILAIGALAGYGVWRMYQSTLEGEHTPKDVEHFGTFGTQDYWRREGYDLTQFGGHHGTRSVWWPYPLALLAMEKEEVKERRKTGIARNFSESCRRGWMSISTATF